ncbi:Transcriptional regulator, MarR family [plant metagenome]|uniref:Transcriptional regulator, MarR family n=1 Tax=plant metagenome TaxID=1297885 RepID=A0A484V8B1_9ZZZZ
MIDLERKHLALLREVDRRGLAGAADIRLCFQVLSLASSIDRDCAALLAPHGLSEGRFVLLFLLDAAPDGLAPHALAREAGVSRATITGLLDGLERAGLVVRQAAADDRRALTVRLTRQGRALAGQLFETHAQWVAGLFGGLSAAERATLAALLDKVGGALADVAA